MHRQGRLERSCFDYHYLFCYDGAALDLRPLSQTFEKCAAEMPVKKPAGMLVGMPAERKLSEQS